MAGGTGTRLYPTTLSINKQLLPIYDKPMIYYPLSTLMMAGIKEIIIVIRPGDIDSFRTLLGNGEKLGIKIRYIEQPKPDGIADIFLHCESLLSGSNCTLILGDNLFHGGSLISILRDNINKPGATIFCYPVSNPSQYGILEFNTNNQPIRITEKPNLPKSNYAVTGLYFYDTTVIEKAKKLTISKRGEYEISDLNNLYIEENNLHFRLLSRGMAWLDTGTHDSLHEASTYISILEKRQGFKVGCPEEIAWRNKWINDKQLTQISSDLSKSGYGTYLLNLLK